MTRSLEDRSGPLEEMPWGLEHEAGFAGRPCLRARTDWFGRGGKMWCGVCDLRSRVVSDHRRYYAWPTMRDLGIGLGLGAVLANTSLDQGFRDWYQDDVRSDGLDDCAAFCKVFGEGDLFLPAFSGLALANVFCGDVPLLGAVGGYGDRVARAYLVGAPPMLLMQAVTGASRPGEVAYESRWSPFQDTNGVSGHAFIGAVPFITAAQMCDSPWVKGGLYLCSTFTAWSRVNDDAHYLSQACLGWWMAYLACRSVSCTEIGQQRVAMVPLATPRMMGVGVVFER